MAHVGKHGTLFFFVICYKDWFLGWLVGFKVKFDGSKRWVDAEIIVEQWDKSVANETEWNKS